jgi:hypothetical protein
MDIKILKADILPHGVTHVGIYLNIFRGNKNDKSSNRSKEIETKWECKMQIVGTSTTLMLLH